MSFEQEEAVLRNTIYPGLENSPAAAMRLGVGVEPFCSAGFGYFVELRSLEV